MPFCNFPTLIVLNTVSSGEGVDAVDWFALENSGFCVTTGIKPVIDGQVKVRTIHRMSI